MVFVAGHPPAKMNGESGSSWDRVRSGYMQSLGMTIAPGTGLYSS
jgi:hypothetical protein